MGRAISLSLVWVAFLLIVLVFLNSDAFAQETSTDCDKYAASETDPGAIAAAVPFDKINSTEAVQACAAALRKYPNNPRLQFQLGRAYQKADNFDLALKYYRQGAQLNYPSAQNSLGNMFNTSMFIDPNETGRLIFDTRWQVSGGTAPDDGLAFAWYRKAAEQGLAIAEYNLGKMYGDGGVVRKDGQQAVAWWRKAADQGLAIAQNQLGITYRNGWWLPKDDNQAMTWFRKAAAQGLADAQSNLDAMARGAQTLPTNTKTQTPPLSSEREQALRPGNFFKECADCPEMILVPAGSFTMGSPPTERGRYDDEGPQHQVTIAKPFAVSKYEVTFAEWDACWVQGGCPHAGDSGFGRGQQPVINVSWDEAKEYVAWLSRITGKSYRLLTEAEYEYAARAGSTTTYPWGDEIELNGRAMANCNDCGNQPGAKQTAPVGSFPPNAFGLYDMVGNVLEWVEDCKHPSYEVQTPQGKVDAPAEGSTWTSGDCGRRVVRGSSWFDGPRELRSAHRYWFPSANSYSLSSDPPPRSYVLGFRVARTLIVDAISSGSKTSSSPPAASPSEEPAKRYQSKCLVDSQGDEEGRSWKTTFTDKFCACTAVEAARYSAVDITTEAIRNRYLAAQLYCMNKLACDEGAPPRLRRGAGCIQIDAPLAAAPSKDLPAANSSASKAAPPKELDEVTSALALCDALDRTRLLSQKCSYSTWNQTVDVSLNMTPGNARAACDLLPQLDWRGYNFRYGWQLRMFSPFSGDRPIATCDLADITAKNHR